MGTLWNTYAFYRVCMRRLTSLIATEHTLEYDKLSIMDTLAFVHVCIRRLKKWMKILATYKIPETAKALQEFCGRYE